ncbi:MAG: hypothetical protein AB7J28_00450 [Hyphomonadaceae bacterium]
MAQARNTRLATVDDGVRIRPVDAGDRQGMLLEERILRSQIQRERASAYWFAATKWGIAGLVAGICIGGYVMYVASVATLPLAQDALARGAAIQDARHQIEEASGLPQENLPQQGQQPLPRR